jgi:RimJ/RimL family protein N-acetyltransferase
MPLYPRTHSTPRLGLRPITFGDFEAIHGLNADPEVMRHIGTGIRDRAESAAHLDKLVRHWTEHGFGPWAMVDPTTDRVIGRCGLQHYDGTDEVELSYALAPAHWGRGLVLEAAAVALDFGFRALNLERIIATVRPANARSHRVLEKLGMLPIAPRERYGHLVDVFAISRPPTTTAAP